MKKVRAIVRKAVFVLLNLWLVYHVFAVFIAPAGMPPSSPLLVDISRFAERYNKLLFLNHGYHYFAPDPGPSTLIAYAAERPGDASATGHFPDPAIRPRLLYHRYFMLAENIGAFPPDFQDDVYDAYARHFSGLNGSNRIELRRLIHDPSSIARIRAGGELSDPETFLEEPIGRYDFSPEGDSTSNELLSSAGGKMNSAGPSENGSDEGGVNLEGATASDGADTTTVQLDR